MPGSAQPERSPKLTSEDNDAGPTLAAGFGSSRVAEAKDDKSNGNSNSGSSVSNSEDHSDEDPVSHSADNSSARHVLEEGELAATLQLLVERAQYITGATGTALALPQGDEMVCRASAGASAPAVGARLQVKSGLTGESISRRQLLRCDNAEADPRVNLEACRALGIASIVVLPLLRKDGEVRGLFELFSDHPYAFEERDLIALERMAALTLTALDLAEQRQTSPSTPSSGGENSAPVVTEIVAAEESRPRLPPSPAHAAKPEPTPDSPQVAALDSGRIIAAKPDAIQSGRDEVAVSAHPAAVHPVAGTSGGSATVGNIATAAPDTLPPNQNVQLPEPLVVEDLPPVLPLRDLELGNLVLDVDNQDVLTEKGTPSKSDSTPVPVAMLRVQKCASCGFPVSEGRTLCLDCERKSSHDKNTVASPSEKAAGDSRPTPAASLTHRIEKESDDKPINSGTAESLAAKNSDVEAGKAVSNEIDLPSADTQDLTTAFGSGDEFVPAFLANSAPFRESWLSRNYVNLLAAIVLILCILVAIVVFR
jgi:putative methionine-R-sulfoxide reductase with GAF domain